MLRPYKGEGERPKHSKVPHLTIAVLLTAYPVCLAEQASASTSSFGSYALGESRLQQPLQPALANRLPFLLGNSTGLGKGGYSYVSPFKLTEQEYQKEVEKATNTLNSAKKALITAQNHLDSLTTAKNKAQSLLDDAQTALDTATSHLDTLKASTDTSADTLADAKSALDTAKQDLTSADEALQYADELLNAQMSTTQSAQTALTNAQTNLTTASANLQSAQNVLNAANTNLSNKLSALQSAQSAYDSSQVANPNYVAPTYTTQPTSYQIPDANFTTGAPWIGDGSGAGQPQIHSGHIHYSYTATEVYQDILIAPRQIANYTFTVSIWNADTNTIGYTGQTPDTYGLRIYFYDTNNNLIHQNSYTSTAVHSWQDVILQGNTNTTTNVASVRIAVYGQDNGFWAGTYGPAMNNVRLTLGWITGSTQAATTTATMPVDIGEGGQATFTAPNGGIFVSSNLRYESYNNPTCGATVTPQLGSNTVTLAADNGVWGDPCGGEVKHLVGTLNYSAAEPQFIKDPTLYVALQTAQQEYDLAQSTYNTAQSSVQQAQSERDEAQSAVAEAQSYVTDYQTVLLNSQSSKDAAVAEVNNKKSAFDLAQSNYEAKQSAFNDSQVALSKAQTDYTAAQTNQSRAQDNFAQVEIDFNTASTQVDKATNDVEDAQQALDSIPEPDPTPTPPPAPEAPEIPEGDPKDLSTEEVAALVTQAEAVLETAEQGSPQYEQALEALAVAAQADDPEISAELAAIPLLGDAAGAALEVLNNLGNVGADMAPAVREEAEKTVIASVIATGAAVNAVQAAAGAAASAATTASTSTSGSSSGGGGGGASGSSDSKPTTRRKSN